MIRSILFIVGFSMPSFAGSILFVKGDASGYVNQCNGPYRLLPRPSASIPDQKSTIVQATTRVKLFSDTNCTQDFRRTNTVQVWSQNDFYFKGHSIGIEKITFLNKKSVWAQINLEVLGCKAATIKVDTLQTYHAIGKGIVGNRHEIYSEKQIRSLAKDPKAYTRAFIVCRDIEFSYQSPTDFFTIGGDTDTTTFQGQFDGGAGLGFSLKGFAFDARMKHLFLPYKDKDGKNILRSTDSYVGLFSRVQQPAVLQNILLKKPFIHSDGEYVGPLAGFLESGVTLGVTAEDPMVVGQHAKAFSLFGQSALDAKDPSKRVLTHIYKKP